MPAFRENMRMPSGIGPEAPQKERTAMSELTHLKPSRTYASADNARKAVETAGFEDLPYYIAYDETGRAHPIFIGDAALRRQVYHAGFMTIC